MRAALCAAIDVLGSAAGCSVVCATTDGFIAEVPLPEGVEIKTDENGIVIPPSIEEILDPSLLKSLESAYPIRVMIDARHKMGCDKWLEIKHVGNEVGSYRTRVNWLTWNNVQQCKAASGMQVDDYNKIREIGLSNTAIPIEKKRLSNMREILEGKVPDVISLITTQMASLPPDGKRVYSPDGLSSFPPSRVDDVIKQRAVIKYRKKKFGEILKPENLLFYSSCAEMGVYVPKNGGLRRVTERMVLRVIARMDKKKYFGGKSNKAIAALLGLKDLKNPKRKAPVYGCIPDCEESRNVILETAHKVGLLGSEDEFERLLFHVGQGGSSLEITDDDVTDAFVTDAFDPSLINSLDDEEWSLEDDWFCDDAENEDDAVMAV